MLALVGLALSSHFMVWERLVFLRQESLLDWQQQEQSSVVAWLPVFLFCLHP